MAELYYSLRSGEYFVRAMSGESAEDIVRFVSAKRARVLANMKGTRGEKRKILQEQADRFAAVTVEYVREALNKGKLIHI